MINNQENKFVNEELNDASEYDEDEIRNKGETMQISNLRIHDSRAHTYKKSTVKMRRRCNVEPSAFFNSIRNSRCRETGELEQKQNS